MPEGLLPLTDLIGFAERIEVAYSGHPHVDEEVCLLADQTKLLCLEHIELRRQMQEITEGPQMKYEMEEQ